MYVKKEAVCVYVSYECVMRVCIMYVYARKERETDSMVHLLLLASYTCVLVYLCLYSIEITYYTV